MCDRVLHFLCFVFTVFLVSLHGDLSVQYNGGLLPDIILLTQSYFNRGTRLNALKSFVFAAFDPT